MSPDSSQVELGAPRAVRGLVQLHPADPGPEPHAALAVWLEQRPVWATTPAAAAETAGSGRTPRGLRPQLVRAGVDPVLVADLLISHADLGTEIRRRGKGRAELGVARGDGGGCNCSTAVGSFGTGREVWLPGLTAGLTLLRRRRPRRAVKLG